MSQYVLDTDIMTLYQHGHPRVCAARLDARLLLQLLAPVAWFGWQDSWEVACSDVPTDAQKRAPLNYLEDVITTAI